MLKSIKHPDIPVIDAHTIVDVGTVVIKHSYAAVTDATVFATHWFHRPTCVTQAAEGIPALLPFIKHGNLNM